MDYQIAPKEVQEIFNSYESLKVPYYISKQGKTIKSRLFKGKGSIEMIKEFIDNNGGVADKKLMEDKGVGIDCSGFVSYLLDAYTTKNLGKHIWEIYKRKTLNPLNLILFKIQPIVSMLNAKTLTSDLNNKKIIPVRDAMPLDLIKMSGGKHIAMIYEIWKKDEVPNRISYIHSTEGVGVCKGYINITNPDLPITKQEFEAPEVTPVNDPGYLIKYHVNMNGIRRPIFLTQ